jgi:hypothetical protein
VGLGKSQFKKNLLIPTTENLTKTNLPDGSYMRCRIGDLIGKEATYDDEARECEMRHHGLQNPTRHVRETLPNPIILDRARMLKHPCKSSKAIIHKYSSNRVPSSWQLFTLLDMRIT